MAYDEYFAERIETALTRKGVEFNAKKMMGGLCFMVNNKMICGPHLNKKANEHFLMVRIGKEAADAHIERPECREMDFTGRPMKGYLFVTMKDLDSDDQLEYWLDLCLEFNKTLV